MGEEICAMPSDVALYLSSTALATKPFCIHSQAAQTVEPPTQGL